MTRLSFAVAAIVCASASLVADEPSDSGDGFTVTKPRKTDEVSVLQEEGATVFAITSRSGIGWVKVRNEGAWPMKAVVRLQYDGQRPWKHLEGFSITNRRASLNTSMQGGLEVRLSNDQGREQLGDLDKQALAEKVGMEVEKVGDAVEIQLPITWLSGENEFTIRWVDLYRN